MAIDVATLIQYIPLILKYAEPVKEILDVAASNQEVVDKIKALSKPVFNILTEIGAKLFPDSADAIHVVGGAIASYDPNITKWVQGSCNEILQLSPALDVDGIYGPKTRDAVKKLQEKFGLKPDGLAGRLTQAAIDSYFASKVAAAASAPRT